MITSTAALLVVSLLISCNQETSQKPLVWAVGIESRNMEVHAAEQEGSMWCWAACIQMVLSTKGIAIKQGDVVKHVYGKSVDLPGNAFDLLRSLSGWPIGPRNSQRLHANVIEGPPDVDTLIRYLETQTPIILGIENPDIGIGHAVVVTAAIFGGSEAGPKLEKVLLRDPSPAYRAQHGKRELTADEYNAVSFHIVLDSVPAN